MTVGDMFYGTTNDAGSDMTVLKMDRPAPLNRLPTLWVQNNGPFLGIRVDADESGVLSNGTDFGVWGNGGSTGVAGSTPVSVAFDPARTDFPPGVWGAGPVGVYGAVPVPRADGTRPVREGCAGVVGRGEARGSHGVKGVAHNRGNGVVGDVDTGGLGLNAGVIGTGRQQNGNGVIGEANNGTLAFGVWGRSTSGYAGYFNGKMQVNGDSVFFGNVQVNGTLNKTSGTFKIDHPLDPENKYLFHSGVESPDMKNLYDGTSSLDDDGGAWIELPEWFGELNRDFRYHLTPIGGPAPDLHIAEEISENRFRIAGGTDGMKVSWQVTGIRKDAWAERNRMVVEEDKPDEARGTYLHPEAFGEPETRGEYHAQEEELRTTKEEELSSRQEERIASEEEHRREMEELRQRMEEQQEEVPPEST